MRRKIKVAISYTSQALVVVSLACLIAATALLIRGQGENFLEYVHFGSIISAVLFTYIAYLAEGKLKTVYLVEDNNNKKES